MNLPRKNILTKNQVRVLIEKMAKTILKTVPEPTAEWVVVGIQRRGVPLAERLGRHLADAGVPRPPVGTLDITFYRDDMDEVALHPIVQDTDIPFDVTGKVVLLVDDVLYTGRTIRSALDELMDFGRPKKIYLVVLVDRGHRELPIHADVAGETVSTAADEMVEVHLEEIDGEDAVWLRSPGKESPGRKGAR
ncbi:MAG TPA: bifunctional pyr operon transcriptional regulator/uracil phosphoribosyltransferase PyrR [Elusimicrobiota bacterium]|nr:bifunctional pyr operon transcriptional regulator/uracil phosphoribosyltransferase PyrR [Elusimicrobiota bacterium]